ncbi:alpha/beta hydrolase fold domain-containing protein [Salmonirosea aquatica]
MCTQKNRYYNLIGWLLVFSLLSGCQVWDQVKPESNYINDTVVDYDFYKDVVYGNNDKVKLDLYQPISLNGHAAEVVILLHGGGWTSGDKSFLKPTVDRLLKEGKNLAIVNMNYRVDSRAGDLLSLQLADLQNAVHFLSDNAEKYNLRKDNYRIVGFSAGGHIALTYAYRTTETNIGTVVAISAPTELSVKEMLDKSLWPNVEILLGKKYGDSIDVFKKASPFHLVSFGSPKTLLVYGQGDVLVSSQQGELLAQKLRLMHVPCKFEVIPGETHELSAEKASQYILDSYQ